MLVHKCFGVDGFSQVEREKERQRREQLNEGSK